LGRFPPVDVDHELIILVSEPIIDDRSRDAFASLRALSLAFSSASTCFQTSNALLELAHTVKNFRRVRTTVAKDQTTSDGRIYIAGG
jgi:hypothetical protein